MQRGCRGIGPRKIDRIATLRYSPQSRERQYGLRVRIQRYGSQRLTGFQDQGSSRTRSPGMPTYEYTCKSCGDHVEVVQSFKDDPLTTCPSCGGILRKVFGNIGIVFKGSGFYKTDNRSGSHSKPSAPQSAEPSKPSGTDVSSPKAPSPNQKVASTSQGNSSGAAPAQRAASGGD